MSNESNLKESNVYIDWLERSISEENIAYYKYSEFKDLIFIGSGSFGSVYRANWRNIDNIYALKSFNNDKTTLKEVVNEKLVSSNIFYHKRVSFSNINYYFFSEEKYLLVLEYADNGTLKTYLSEHFSELGWSDKYQLALQLASAVAFIHECDIIHRDLHASNIFVHQKRIKLADFGLSKKIASSSSTSKIFGVIPFIDPKSLSDQDQSYRLDKKSDVYSFGVLMWQISSGYQPFSTKGIDNSNYNVCLILSIVNGKREKIIGGTPVEYSDLYTECWKYEPDERPNMYEVVLALKNIISPGKNNTTSGSAINNENISLEKSVSKSDDILDVNASLSIDSDMNTYMLNNVESTEPENVLVSQKKKSDQSNTIVVENNSTRISIHSNLSRDSFEIAFNEINNIIVEKLITFTIKKHDEGANFDNMQQLIEQQILRFNQPSSNILNWLLKNQVKPQYKYILGVFYYYNISNINENDNESFELFLQASKDSYPIAQVYLGKCYNDGYGIECDKDLAFNWYQKSAENESIIGQFYLGNCYEFGIGIVKDMIKSVYWYQKAANNGNAIAKLYLADCYRLGKGVNKDETKAFNYYENLAKLEIADAQYQLGNCFYNGIGTKIDEIQAKCWYEKATKNGNIIAKDVFKKNYTKKVKIETNKIKEIKLQKILNFRRLNQFGLNYFGTIFAKNNQEKGLNYIKKATMNELALLPFSINNYYKKDIGIKKNGREAFEFHKILAEQGNINAKFQLGYCYDEGIGTEINK
ncbi:kinase-like domain-containing protein, partial [Rhizophagus diaphanus]